MPDQDHLAFPGPAAVGPEEAVGAVGDLGLHRVSLDLGHEVIAGEPDAARHRHPPDFVMFRADSPVLPEGAGGGWQVVDRCVNLERPRPGAVNDPGSGS